MEPKIYSNLLEKTFKVSTGNMVKVEKIIKNLDIEERDFKTKKIGAFIT